MGHFSVSKYLVPWQVAEFPVDICSGFVEIDKGFVDALLANPVLHYTIKKFNKSMFFQFLKKSFSISVLISFLSLIYGDFIDSIILAIVSFFGIFAILTVIFYIEQLFNIVLNKIKKKEIEGDKKIK